MQVTRYDLLKQFQTRDTISILPPNSILEFLTRISIDFPYIVSSLFLLLPMRDHLFRRKLLLRSPPATDAGSDKFDNIPGYIYARDSCVLIVKSDFRIRPGTHRYDLIGIFGRRLLERNQLNGSFRPGYLEDNFIRRA